MRVLFLAIVCILLLVLGQTLLKYGLGQMGGVSFSGGNVLINARRVLSTPHVLTGFVVYAVSAVLWLEVLSKLDLSMAYPLVSLSYVFSLLVGKFLFREVVTWERVVGVLLICGGVMLVARS